MRTFSWTPHDMPGIDPSVMSHSLNISNNFPPVKQKQRRFDPEVNQVIQEEVQRLLSTGAIEECLYPSWLANPVVVPKKNGKKRVCIDYTNLNKACPKDSYPLPKIDQMIDAKAGYERMSFLDAHSGYNQIPMKSEDQIHTAFITEGGLYCYKVMPFGLKNAGATYQRLMHKLFSSLLGRNMEVYIDDMVIKSKQSSSHINDLTECFDILDTHKMKLNPSKCVFGVSSGQFLGYVVSQRGIEANPTQIASLSEVKEPRTIRDIQALTDKVVALSRFISRMSDRCQPFLQCIKKSTNTTWGPEQKKALEELKTYLSSPPILSSPIANEDLFLYLSVSQFVVSSVLFREEDNRQRPVFYCSKMLLDAETRYSMMEKLALALLTAKKKLRQYFESHTIIVYTDYPLKQVLSKPDLSGRLSKWAIELGTYDIQFSPRKAKKGQVLADFLVEIQSFTPGALPELLESEDQWVWTMYTDGASNSQGAEAPSGLKIEEAIRLEQSTTNNEAEYEALIYGLELAREMGIQRLNVRGDSQLMIEQVAGNFDTKAPHLASLLQKVIDLRSHFRQFELIQVPREQNQKADALAKLASAGGCTRQSTISISRSSEDMGVYSTSSEPECWVDPIIKYLTTSELPPNPKDAKLLRLRAQRYSMIHGTLYRKSFNGPYLRCLRPSEAKKLLEEIHEGTCGNHTGGRSLAHKALTVGYYWPYMMTEARDYTKKCDKCQRFAPTIHQPAQTLHSIVAPWPFAKWGMDVVGELPKAAGGRRYALVATDYFTKWVVAEAYVTVSKTDTMSFIWKHIICRFGIPWEIVVENGTLFQNAKVQELYDTYKIKLSFASVTYPQGNGQAEASNKVIFANIKKNLEDKKGAWVEELSKVLWAYRTTKRSSTGESPYAMVYGTEAVIPTEVGPPTLRTKIASDPTTNNIQLLHNLDLLEEARTMTQLRLENYQKVAERYYNKRVHSRTFREGDWVLHKVTGNKKKLEPNWEGPFQIIKVRGRGSYTLKNMLSMKSEGGVY
ncbi:uncharacterized protein LOC133806667 [Humulus lupulus]|uniref:uncharacterized protein LOC133806667 n=1 Tax=Humulus lupulus TaxID=3486 RepID=UPI002B415BE4|nr:uncharacterized protein LOC133806667 [Humulus lupulus]